MRKLFRCLVDRRAHLQQGNSRGKYENKTTQREGEWKRALSLTLSADGNFSDSDIGMDSSTQGRCLPASTGSVWEKRSEIQEVSAGRRSARALNVVLYILFIYRADRSVNYVSVFVCVALCVFYLWAYLCVRAPLETAYLGCIVGTQPHWKCKSHIYLYICIYSTYIYACTIINRIFSYPLCSK